jgi:hypothetical protein
MTAARRATGDASRRADLPVHVIRFAELDGERQGLLMRVHQLLDSIDFGAVLLVLQDKRVIQVETSEKIRLR